MYESNSSIELHALTITGSIFGLNDNSDAIDVAFGRDKLDLFHRVKEKAVPIHFKSIEQFLKMKYNDGSKFSVTLKNSNNKALANKEVKFVLATLGNDAGIYGAARLAL